MAANFNGTSSRLIYTKSTSATDLSIVTYAFWLKRDLGAANRDIFWNGGAWSTLYHSFVQYDNGLSKLCFVADWTTAEARWSITNTADDTAWHHHVITYDFGATTNDPEWWIDDATKTITEVVTPTGTSSHAADDGTLTLGAYDDGSAEFWGGKIAEFSIFNRALTAGERTSLAGGASASSYLGDGLVFHARLEDNDYADLVSGNAPTNTAVTNFAHPTITDPSQSSPRYLIQGGI